MANVRGRRTVHLDNGSGSVSAVVGTTAWTSDMLDTLGCTAHGSTAKNMLAALKVQLVL